LGNDLNALIGKRFRRREPRFRFRGTSLHTCLDPTAAAAPVPVRPWGSVLTFYAAVRPFAAPVPAFPPISVLFLIALWPEREGPMLNSIELPEHTQLNLLGFQAN
jgi:hypothetical protein